MVIKMIDNFKFKENYKIDDLLEIMRILRSPGGCPWDMEQTHETLKKDFIEETYEVIEAINKQDKVLLEEELGDALLQVVFHAQLEAEAGCFDFDRVCDGICKKLIVRHPHVFGDVTVSSTGEVLSNWDDIKRKTKNQKTTTEAIAAVPRELPALMRANKIQAKAAKSGMDADCGVAERAVKCENPDENTIGELLFAAVSLARKNGIDPEEALTAVTDRFAANFAEKENNTAK